MVFVGGGETGGCGEENAVFRVAVGGSGDVEVGELGVDLVGVAKVRGCGFESGSRVAVWINVCLCGGGGNVWMGGGVLGMVSLVILEKTDWNDEMRDPMKPSS